MEIQKGRVQRYDDLVEAIPMEVDTCDRVYYGLWTDYMTTIATK
jgi:hypothetical protein